MNTARSVAYGWVALIVAAGGSYYYAKKDLKGRKMDPAVREARSQQQLGNMTWEDRLRELGQAGQSAPDSGHRTEATGANADRPASRNHAEDVKMDSRPTGVDTSTSGPGARSER